MANRNTRRDFLKTTAVAAGTAVPYFAWNPKAFANNEKNDRPVIGCIGTGSMGSGDARDISRFGDIVAVCDVDANHANAAKNDPNIGKGKADVYKEYRKVLDRKDIDVVTVVTPDHWHTRIAIEALQAGKHVFCQKPLTLTVAEKPIDPRGVQEVRQAGLPGRDPAAESDGPLPLGDRDDSGRASGRNQKGAGRNRRRADRRPIPHRRPAGMSGLGNVARPGAQGSVPQPALATTNSAGGTNTPAAS